MIIQMKKNNLNLILTVWKTSRKIETQIHLLISTLIQAGDNKIQRLLWIWLKFYLKRLPKIKRKVNSLIILIIMMYWVKEIALKGVRLRKNNKKKVLLNQVKQGKKKVKVSKFWIDLINNIHLKKIKAIR